MLSSKQLGYLTVFFLFLCLVSIFFVDQPLAFFIHNQASVLQPFFKDLTALTDLLTGYTIWKYLSGVLILVAGIVLFTLDRSITRAKYFFFVSLTELTSRLLVGTLKNVFERERPEHFLETGQPIQTFWIPGGDSFPSGHAGRYFGIFLPLMVIFPKNKLFLLVVPLYISLGRLILSLHYLSDVFASIYLVIIITTLYAYLLMIGPRRGQHASEIPESVRQ